MVYQVLPRLLEGLQRDSQSHRLEPVDCHLQIPGGGEGERQRKKEREGGMEMKFSSCVHLCLWPCVKSPQYLIDISY